MDGRKGMTLQNSASYYLSDRGGFVGSGPDFSVHGPDGRSSSGGIRPPSVFKNLSNHPNIPLHQTLGISITGNSAGGSSEFHVDSSSYDNNNNSGSQVGNEKVKKKRGRPRKYGPDGPTKVSLKLSSPVPGPMNSTSSGPDNLAEKGRRGRPPGSGWKQKLAPLGEWMNRSAGLAFTPHVLHIGAGEDIAMKILAFAQQRPRALCILSGSGSVSAVTLRQPTTSAGSVTYEGRFEILCLSGSYLVAEGDDPRSRTGGISISVCSPHGHMIGGALGGRLIAANHVQVVACSFIYDGDKGKIKPESGTADEKYLLEQSAGKSYSQTPFSAATPNSEPRAWQLSSRLDAKKSHPEIDLSRG